ncbi:MAG: ParA family protein [Frankiaceae bacterium]
MRIVAIANHKGGVGKTTTAVNLAAGLARSGYRTLLVDVDAQAHATFWFVDDPDEIEFDLQDVISKSVPIDKTIRRTRIVDLDLLPATLALAPLETELVSMTRREDRIQRALAGVNGYDFAVLDLAPSLSLVTLAALVAATDIAAPVSATKLAVGGLGAFLGWTEQFRAEGLITAPLLGILITMVDQRTRVTRDVVEALANSELPVFDTTIPRRIAAEDQVGDRLVVGDEGANGDLDDAYRRFVQEVILRTGVHRG